MDRRTFLASSALLPAAPTLVSRAQPVSAPHTTITDEPSIAQCQRAMASGELTSRALTERYLARIDATDRKGPALRSVIEVNPDALRLAEAADAARAAGRPHGPLHGIPILLKDNIDTADRLRTSAGSLALAEWTPPRDAFLVERLRAAGAVLLGKTNLSEWANFRSTRSTSGWSSRGGQTKNPYVLDRNPCGSSSGSGTAVAASLCAAAVGTETDGSIVCPANMASLVGIKPTVGLVSRSGIIPISASQDTAGPMARTVADAALLLAAMAGVDPRDPATAASRSRTGDYAAALVPGALTGARIGVLRNFFGFQPAVDRLMDEAIGVLRGNGAVIVDPADFPTKGRFDDDEFTVLLHEFKQGLNAYLAPLPATAPARTLEALIAWNEANRETVMPFFGQEIFIQAQRTTGLKAPAYVKARANCLRQSRALGFDALFAKHRLDAVVAPTGSPAWPTDHLNGDHFTGGSSTPSAVAGYPAITVPAGFVGPLPVGITFMGLAWTEAKLIGLAYGFEQATKLRRPPSFLPTLGESSHG
jgi:amidase